MTPSTSRSSVRTLMRVAEEYPMGLDAETKRVASRGTSVSWWRGTTRSVGLVSLLRMIHPCRSIQRAPRKIMMRTRADPPVTRTPAMLDRVLK